MNENSLNEKLNRIDETLNIMKTNLHLSENEVIENLAEATNLHGLVNIYAQIEEPNAKEGIWFQTDCSFKDIIMEDSPIVPNEIRTAEQQLLTQSTTQSTRGSIAVDNTLYCVKSTNELIIICYDLLTHTTTEINTGKVYNYTIACPFMVYKDGYLYMLITPAYQYQAVKFNLSTHECETFSIVNPQTSCYSAYDNKIYYGGTSSGSGSDYDVYSFSLDTCTQELAVSYFADALKVLYPVGQYLIGFSGVKGRSQVRDITNGYNSVSHKIGNFDVDASGGIAYFLEVGKYVYLIYSGKNGIVHRLDKDTISVEENVLSLGDLIYILGGFEYNGQLYLIYSQDRNYGRVPYYYAPLSLEGEDYENNSVIISQAPCVKTEKRTQLWDIVFNNRLLYSFYDAYYYNKEDGFILNIPTYYGNGTE